MKKSIQIILVFALLITLVPVAFAANELKVLVGGKAIDFPDAKPFIDQNNRTQIPIAVLARALGADVSWDQGTQTARIVKAGKQITITIGKSEMSVDDEIVNMDTAAVLLSNRTFIPVSFVAQALDYTVRWDAINSTVSLTQNNQAFAYRLMESLPKDSNYMVSPISIKIAFAMVANGANGVTKDEILSTLGIDNLDEFNNYAKELIKAYGENSSMELKIANSIWLNTDCMPGVDFSESFGKTVSDYYNAKSGTVNDSNAADTINRWISDNTNGKIDNAVSGSDFLAALVNATYFKADWARQFSQWATKEAEFTNADDTVSNTDFMNMTGYFKYYSDKSVQMISLPYTSTKSGGGGISMYIALTDGGYVNYESIFEKTEVEDVRLSIPKFSIKYDVKLNDILKQLGIKTAFDKYVAELSPMFNEPGEYYIEKATHKTYIDVDENGTEAAAATVIEVAPTSMPIDDPIEFTANRPFVFFIRDDLSGEILFMGEYLFAK